MMVRRATYDDVDAAVALGEQHHAESEQRWLPFVPERLAAYARQFIDDDDKLALVAVSAKGEVVGYMGAFLAPYIFCEEMQAADLMVFVTPEYRGSTAALRLIRAYAAWAQSMGALEATLALRSNVNVERAGRFYQKLGFEQHTPSYVMRF